MFYPTLNKSKPELIQFEFMQLEDTGTSTLPSQKRFANEDFNGKPVYQMNASKSPMSIDENLNLPSPTLSPSRIDSSSESNQLQISDVKSVFPNFDGTALDLQSLPNIIEKFDQLSQQLKSYLLFQLLKRCPVPTLQFISCLMYFKSNLVFLLFVVIS